MAATAAAPRTAPLGEVRTQPPLPWVADAPDAAGSWPVAMPQAAAQWGEGRSEGEREAGGANIDAMGFICNFFFSITISLRRNERARMPRKLARMHRWYALTI